MARTKARPSLVGLSEIADLLRVKPATVDQWRFRRVLPEPDHVISGTPIWHRETIVAWAVRTGRQPAE